MVIECLSVREPDVPVHGDSFEHETQRKGEASFGDVVVDGTTCDMQRETDPSVPSLAGALLLLWSKSRGVNVGCY
jgi:hypothetical protein